MFDILRVNEEIFQFLTSWNRQMLESTSINPYFSTKRVTDSRFKEGVWFPGTETSIYISFWNGGDAFNKTPNAFFEISEENGCRAVLSSKDSEIKNIFLTEIADELNRGSVSKRYIRRKGVFYKTYDKSTDDYMQFLTEYIQYDKNVIDDFIDNLGNTILLDEFTQPFNFLNNVQFEELIYKIHNQKQENARIKAERLKNEINLPRLPFALRSIRIENYQGIKSASIKDLPIDTQWIFITGENGYGKTSFLQSIALAFSNTGILESYFDSTTRIECDAVYKDEEESVKRIKDNIFQITDLDYEKYIIGYGPSRLNIQAETSENEEARSRSNIVGLFDSSTLLKSLSYELFATDKIDKNSFASLASIIKEITGGRITGIKVDNREVYFQEIVNGNEEMDWLPLNNLATGFKNLINIVGDIFIRFSTNYQHTSYRDFYGIVMIDELENHLHPILQKELPAALSKVFPRIQFIATTHSPIPLLGSPPKTVILTVKRSKEKGVEIQRLLKLEKQIRTLLPDAILTSSIFNFDYLEKLSDDEFNQLSLEDKYEDIDKYQKLNNRLQNISKNIFPDQIFDEE